MARAASSQFVPTVGDKDFDDDHKRSTCPIRKWRLDSDSTTQKTVFEIVQTNFPPPEGYEIKCMKVVHISMGESCAFLTGFSTFSCLPASTKLQ